MMDTSNKTLPLSLCSFFEQLPFPALLIDSERIITYVNAAALSDNPALEPLGRCLTDVLPSYADALARNPNLAGTTGVPVARQGSDGPQYYRLWSLNEGTYECLITVGEDCSIGAQTMRLASLGFMIAGVCHDINRPLSALHSMVQFLREETADAATLERALSNMALSVDYLLQISRTLGQFSRAESVSAAPVALETAVYEATSMLNQQHLGQQISVNCSNNLNHVVSARAGELRQVFLNLFINAAQAMDWTGTIYVCAEPVDSGVKISVRDTGPGIPDKIISQLFDPFFTTKRTSDGIGLGLTICSQILREHGGLLSVENHPDGGALFHFVLPKPKPDARLQ